MNRRGRKGEHESAGISGGHRRREERDPGEKFYLSQPSLSRHVSNVEREMGEKLFERRNGELHLTDAGTIYINGARAILAAERQAMEEIAGLDEHGGHVQGQ